MGSTRVCHISTVHVPFDQRIFHRECWSLARAGYEVHLLVQLDDAYRLVDGVHVHSVGAVRKHTLGLRLLDRFTRILRAERLARKLRARVYHLHDPELIPLGLWLKCVTGASVIFDCHENNTGFVKQKHYLHPLLRTVLMSAMVAIERIAARFLDAVVTADTGVEELYRTHYRANHLAVVHNFPRLDLFVAHGTRGNGNGNGHGHGHGNGSGARNAQPAAVQVDPDDGDAGRTARSRATTPANSDWDSKQFDLVYHGSIPRYHLEVAFEVAEELQRRGVQARWLFFGKCPEAPWAESELERRGLRKQFVIDPSFVPHEEVAERVRQARIGFIPLPDLPKFQHNIPTKLFEFMGLGMPTVLSDLPPSRKFVGDGRCAVMVRPDDYAGYADAIAALLDDPERARAMGSEAIQRTREHFNWEAESTNLLDLYRTVVEG